MVPTATAAQTLSSEAFNQLVLERGLFTWKVGEYRHAGYRGPNGWELYRTLSTDSLDECTETTAVTANPAAGVISVDVKTFTGRGCVSAIEAACLADANVAARYLQAFKVSGTNTLVLATSATFAATQTGLLQTRRGWQGAQAASSPALAETDFGPGDILRVSVLNGQAGDDMTAITYSYKEML